MNTEKKDLSVTVQTGLQELYITGSEDSRKNQISGDLNKKGFKHYGKSYSKDNTKIQRIK